MQLRYSFRLYPSAGQRMALARAFGCVRVVFNDALRVREEARAAGAPFVLSSELSKRLTASKKTPERAWLGEVSSVVLQQSLRDLDTAYRNFFDGLKGKRPRTGPPRYKSRKDARQSIRFTANASWRITAGGKLRLPKIGDVPVRWSRRLPSTPSTVTVVNDSAGRYFASFVIETGSEEVLPAVTPEVGVDLGLGHFAVLSDGTKVDSPRFLRRAEERLKKAQRELSRKQEGSANRGKARTKVARAHARVADARREFHHRLSTKLIRENQAVAVEDLSVKGLARTRLAKSVHDAGWSAFVSMLEYKAARYGRTFVRIGRFEPTSQVCSVCGVKDGPKPLDVREWTCEECGAVLDRDVNAAVNVARAAGLAVPACGAQVGPVPVPAQRGEAGTHRDPQLRVVGIPLLQSREEVNATATASPPAPPTPPTAPAVTSASASPADACRTPAGHPSSTRQHPPNTR
ncbi:transposase [Kitasatospora sp. NRRL B-11411]|uniref:RNA-guided endonuclease InsQ/TnpB family protein n=1 Tax=Kitasatospora sp. NRRL B-11411 TaxID=1463822 RepID=UPI000A4EA974|nr:transposase [Kitasatospora sp. NRRL B-11411]